MTTTAEQLLKSVEQQEKDRDSFALQASEQVAKMASKLAEVLGSPAETETLKVTQIANDDDTIEGYDGTLLSRNGCHFGILVTLSGWQMRILSVVYPAGGRLKCKTDEGTAHALDVTDDAGVQAWVNWAAHMWIPSQFADTISGAISAKMKKS